MMNIRLAGHSKQDLTSLIVTALYPKSFDPNVYLGPSRNFILVTTCGFLRGASLSFS